MINVKEDLDKLFAKMCILNNVGECDILCIQYKCVALMRGVLFICGREECKEGENGVFASLVGTLSLVVVSKVYVSIGAVQYFKYVKSYICGNERS